MVEIASRAICLLGIRKNALGATALCVAAGFPDLVTVIVLCRRPEMLQTAASNAFGAYVFNALLPLGLPWAILGAYADVFPPARGTFFTALVGFACIGVGTCAVAARRFVLDRPLGVVLLLLYAAYLTIIIHDGATRWARPAD